MHVIGLPIVKGCPRVRSSPDTQAVHIMSSTADVEAAKKGGAAAAKGGMGTPIKILLVVGLLAVAGGGAAVRARAAP